MPPMKPCAFAALICLPLLFGSCAPVAGRAFLSRTSSAANDHIMLVRQLPPTLGFQRLSSLATVYPDLMVFLNQRRYPDFLAETNKGENRYLILYYIEPRQAFACRSGAGESRQVEFSGPYPITDGEVKTLNALGSGANSGER